MATKVGKQDGIVAEYNRLRDLDPGGTLLVKGSDGKWPDMWEALAGIPVDQWKAYDKAQRRAQIMKDDHDAAISGGGNSPGPSPEPPPNYLAVAQARIFLANHPLDCLRAPAWMVPVCTADLGYRDWYGTDTIKQLRDRFGRVESWCDCRNPTAYQVALDMAAQLGLDGAWGQCETTGEFDHGYANGARRMVGQINSAVLDDARLARVASGEVLISLELYCNLQPNLQPDYRNANAGIGGHCIACYASDTEGALYTPVAWYRNKGYYRPTIDSVYGVGLHADDWADLA